jgi:hypothetical protein
VNYLSVEELEFRKNLFMSDLVKVQHYNSDPDSTAEYSTNFMSDWTQEEKNSMFGTAS